MQKPPLAPFILLALALIGISDTLYLSYNVYAGTSPGCLLEGCELVLNSAYSKVFDIPLSYIGLVYYTYMLLFAVMLSVEPRSWALRLGTLAYSTVGLLMSASFIYIQGALIGAWCQYCLLSALTSTLLFITAFIHWRRSAKTLAPER